MHKQTHGTISIAPREATKRIKKAGECTMVHTFIRFQDLEAGPPCYGECLLRLAYLFCSDINSLKTLVAFFYIKGNIIAFSQ